MQQSRKTVIFFAILMIVTGALIFAYPFISNALETRHATVAVQAYQQSVQTLQKEDIDADATHKLHFVENTNAFDVRANLQKGGFSILGEYAQKTEDPTFEIGRASCRERV